MNTDYERIAHAIGYLQQRMHEQPGLAELAQQVNLSEYHFQRLFSRWAGVSPKRYLQYLTLEHAKQLLRDGGASVLDASDELGLSSSSRLYDHFVQIEAVSPSEYRNNGLGLCIRHGVHPTPYGEVFIASTERGICALSFLPLRQGDHPLAELRTRWPAATFEEAPDHTAASVKRIFTATPKRTAPLTLWVRGTNFQLRVWRALLDLQPGEVCSYGDIARRIDKPSAVRAVGTAVGANPVALLIPCHRVLRRGGGLGGYRWGEVRKQAILAREGARNGV